LETILVCWGAIYFLWRLLTLAVQSLSHNVHTMDVIDQCPTHCFCWIFSSLLFFV
jgi:hypothetical protein